MGTGINYGKLEATFAQVLFFTITFQPRAGTRSIHDGGGGGGRGPTELHIANHKKYTSLKF